MINFEIIICLISECPRKMMCDQEDVDWSDSVFVCPEDDETPEDFHGFSADTVVQGRLEVEEQGGQIIVTRSRRRGKPRGHVQAKPDAKLILNTRRRQTHVKVLEPPPCVSYPLPVRRSVRLAPSPPSLPTLPPIRKRGRPRSGELPPPVQPPAPSGPDALPAVTAEASGTGSRPLLYLIGKPNLATITKKKLPKTKQILHRLEGMLLSNSSSSKGKTKKMTN